MVAVPAEQSESPARHGRWRSGVRTKPGENAEAGLARAKHIIHAARVSELGHRKRKKLNAEDRRDTEDAEKRKADPSLRLPSHGYGRQAQDDRRRGRTRG